MTPAGLPSGPPPSQSPLKLLVFAGIPPPVHGQAVMVASLLTALRTDPAFSVQHIDPRLSQATSEIGRWRPGKLFRLALACGKALRARVAQGPMAFYYVPAPGNRVPVFRDWMVMACCRPFFPDLILHWHAVGLGGWTIEQASPVERLLTQFLFRGARLSIVLAPELAGDAALFKPRELTAVPNGIPDPLRGDQPAAAVKHPATEVLFLGLGSEAKGLFRTLDAVKLANARQPGAFRLTFAGAFESRALESRFRDSEKASSGLIRYAGFADAELKAQLLRTSDLLCFPTTYSHEGQPLVLLEALAYDLPIVTTRWRSIPSMLPTSPRVHYVDPKRPDEIAQALIKCREDRKAPADNAGVAGEAGGELRRHFLAHFTLENHLRVMKAALLSTQV